MVLLRAYLLGAIEKRRGMTCRARNAVPFISVRPELLPDEKSVKLRENARFAVYRAIRLGSSPRLPRECPESEPCGPETAHGERRAKREGERTKPKVDTDAVGGSWRRNDYRPETYSLPAIISSTNAFKSILDFSRGWDTRMVVPRPSRSYLLRVPSLLCGELLGFIGEQRKKHENRQFEPRESYRFDSLREIKLNKCCRRIIAWTERRDRV